MPRRRPTGPVGPSHRGRWLSGVIVAVLAVGVIVLTVLALERGRGDAVLSSSAHPAPIVTASESASPTPTPTPTPTPVVAAPGAAERLLAIGTGAMWRATAGACGGPAPVIERSTDGGSTWTNVTPTYRGIAQVLSLDPLAGDQAEIVARVGASCELQALRTFTYGEFWEPYPDVLAASTYVDPSNPASVVTPRGAVAAPCPTAWGLRSAGSTVAIICDGTAYELSDGAWQPVATDAVAVALRNGDVIAAGAQEGCSGLVIGQACTGVAEPSSPAAIAVSDTDVFLWLGDRVTTVPGA